MENVRYFDQWVVDAFCLADIALDNCPNTFNLTCYELHCPYLHLEHNDEMVVLEFEND